MRLHIYINKGEALLVQYDLGGTTPPPQGYVPSWKHLIIYVTLENYFVRALRNVSYYLADTIYPEEVKACSNFQQEDVCVCPMSL